MPCERKHVEAIRKAVEGYVPTKPCPVCDDFRNLNKLIHAAIAACDESPWRSMDVPMLPVDGEVVLLWSPSFCHRPVEAYRSTSGKWWLVNGIEVQFPTHWMPLPAAPEVKL